jgi:hypothetical protein
MNQTFCVKCHQISCSNYILPQPAHHHFRNRIMGNGVSLTEISKLE